MSVKIIKEAYEDGMVEFFMKDTPYNRQCLSAFKGATGIEYYTTTFEGDMVVVFRERQRERMLAN